MKALFLFSNNYSSNNFCLVVHEIVKTTRFKASEIFLLPRNRKEISLIKKIKENWDVIIVQEVSILNRLSRILTRIPIIFFSISNEVRAIPFVINNLSFVINLGNNFKTLYNVPKEIIYDMQLPLMIRRNKSKLKKRCLQKFCMIYIFDQLNQNTISIILKLIQIVNGDPRFNITFQANSVNGAREAREISLLIRKLSKDNSKIFFKPSKLEGYDLVICDGYNARNSVINGLNTMIIGNNGFGGIVNKANIRLFQKYGFEGRPGGKVGEIIPLNLISDEISYLINNNSNLIFPDFKYKVEDKDSFNLFKNAIYRICKKAVCQHENLYNDLKIATLIPKIASNIIFEQYDDKTVIKRMPYEEPLGILGKKEFEVIEMINGKKSIGNILKVCPRLSNELDFFRHLWEIKIILL